MTQTSGVLAAVLSSALGGTAIGATRYLAPALDPVTIGAIRFAGGFLALLPVALWRRDPWPPRADWGGVAALGLMFFGLFPVLFNASVIYTTAAARRSPSRPCRCSPWRRPPCCASSRSRSAKRPAC